MAPSYPPPRHLPARPVGKGGAGFRRPDLYARRPKFSKVSKALLPGHRSGPAEARPENNARGAADGWPRLGPTASSAPDREPPAHRRARSGLPVPPCAGRICTAPVPSGGQSESPWRLSRTAAVTAIRAHELQAEGPDAVSHSAAEETRHPPREDPRGWQYRSEARARSPGARLRGG